MVWGGRRTQGRYGIFHTVLRQCHHVHITFNHQYFLPGADSFLCLEQTIQLAAFFKQRCFRRVEVFRLRGGGTRGSGHLAASSLRGLTLIQYASAEADDLTAHIDDRKHDAVTESIVAFILFAGDHQTSFAQRCILVIRKRGGQILPTVRRITNAEFCGNLATQAALLEIVDRSLG